MSHKSPRIAELIKNCHGYDLDPHYLGYFECFNQQLFFEAHEVLEEIWLPQRHQPIGNFYKGLIQFAGAFVHVQKNRPGPALALLRLARQNLAPYAPLCERLLIAPVLALIDSFSDRISSSMSRLQWQSHDFPRLAVDFALRSA